MQSKLKLMGCEASVGEEVTKIPVTKIHCGKLKIRSTLGDLDELKTSIIKRGLLSPIIVRRLGASDFEVIAGNRRLRACKDLGFPRIFARVVQADDRECLEIFLTENVQRQTLDPVDEAKAFYSYVRSKEKLGLGYGSITELAEKIGKSQAYVSNRIGLLRLQEPVLRQLLDERKLSVSYVEDLASISDHPRAVKELVELVTTHRISIRVLEKAVQLIKCGLGTSRAVSLAEIESDMRLGSTAAEGNPDQVSELLKRTKRVLEATLKYLDETLPELEKKPAICNYWVTNVRMPVHTAIDGTIVCQKRWGRR